MCIHRRFAESRQKLKILICVFTKVSPFFDHLKNTAHWFISVFENYSTLFVTFK